MSFTVDRVIYTILDPSNVSVTSYDILDVTPWNLTLNPTVTNPSDPTSNYNVISIGPSAFNACSQLLSISIPNSITSFGDLSFYDCSQLVTISIPDSVTSIGVSSFQICFDLQSVIFTGSPTIQIINGFTFAGCKSLISIIIPNSVTSIGSQVFRDCLLLPSIIIPNSVTSIGDYLFYQCLALASITFDTPSQITAINDYTFLQCIALTNITIPNSVKSIGSNAFIQCITLKNITMNKNVISIDNNAFNDCSLIKYASPPPLTYPGTLYTDSLPGEYVYDYFLPPGTNDFYLNYVNTNPPIPPIPTNCFLRTVNLGAVNGKGSSTRIFNFCKKTNGSFYCLSTFNCNCK